LEPPQDWVLMELKELKVPKVTKVILELKVLFKDIQVV
jgi:hypothetical protein